METRIALVSIIIENADAVEKVNGVLHEHADSVIGRMGIPYKARHCNIISVAMDAPCEEIDAIAAEIGQLEGVGVNTLFANMPE